MYRITLACDGIPVDLGATAAADIAEEFTHRPWHRDVTCEWDGTRLILRGDNDHDATGAAFAEEFSDAISACVAGGSDGAISLLSVETLGVD